MNRTAGGTNSVIMAKKKSSRMSLAEEKMIKLNKYNIATELKGIGDDSKCHLTRHCEYGEIGSHTFFCLCLLPLSYCCCFFSSAGNQCFANLQLLLPDVIDTCFRLRHEYFSCEYMKMGEWWYDRIYCCRVPQNSAAPQNRNDSGIGTGKNWAIQFAVEGVAVCKAAFLRFYGFAFKN